MSSAPLKSDAAVSAPPPPVIGARQFASTFVVNLVIQTCTILQGILLARLLGPEGRGQFAGAILWPSVFAGVGGLGMGVAIARRSARAVDLRPTLRAAVVLSLATGAVATVLCAIALPWLLANVDESTRSGAWLFLPFIISNHLALTLIAVDHGAGRFASYNFTRVLINPIYLTIIVTLWLAGARSTPWFVAALAASNGVVAAWRLLTAAWETRGWGPVDPLAAVFREALPFGVAGLATPLLTAADKALLLYLLGETQLGLHAVAFTAASVLASLSQAGAAISFGMSVQGDDAATFRRVARVFRCTAWIWCVGGVALAIAMPLLLPLIYGREFASAVVPAIILILPVALAGQASILEDAMRGQGRAFVGLEARIAGMTTFVAIGWYSAERWGLPGAAVAYAVGQAIVLTIMMVSSRVHFRDIGVSVLIPKSVDLHDLITRVVVPVAARVRARREPVATQARASVETK